VCVCCVVYDMFSVHGCVCVRIPLPG